MDKQHGLCEVSLPLELSCSNNLKLAKHFCYNDVSKYFFNNIVVDAGDWILQDWKMTDEVAGVEFAGLEMTDEVAGVEFAGLENEGRSRRGGICRTGK